MDLTIFEPTDVICEVDRLVVRDDGEALGGSEPYLWSIFFKLDGEDLAATIDIGNDGVSLSLHGDPFVDSPDEGSHGNIGGEVRAGGPLEPGKAIVEIPSRVGRFTTTLEPIPATVKIDPDSWIADVIRDVVFSVDSLIDSLSGNDLCPGPEEDPSQFVGRFSTEFLTQKVGGLPGAFGAVYILMEEDFTSETATEKGRRAFRDQFREELKETVMPSISFTNQAPGDATMEEIEIRLTDAVTDAVMAGMEWWEWLTVLPAIDPEDTLGSAQVMMSHLAIKVGGEQKINEDFSAPKGNGDWSLRGRIGRNS